VPYVWVGWREAIVSGTINGSSVSRVVEGVGTQAWHAQGNYIGGVEESFTHAVRWLPYSRGIAETDNEVVVDFTSSFNYYVSGDVFTNQEVTGVRSWRTNVLNIPDETGAPIAGLGLTLATELVATNPWCENLVKEGPPVFEWFYGDAPEVPESARGKAYTESGVEFGDEFPATWQPGFDVTRTVDKTVFSAPDTQTLTITVTPREEKIGELHIAVHTRAKDIGHVMEDAFVTSYTNGENIMLSPDADDLYISKIPMELNTPWSITVTIRVIPKMPDVEFVPFIGIIWNGPGGAPSQGTTSGSFISYNMGGAGTWTWSAEGNYVWNWWAQAPHYVLGLMPLSDLVGKTDK